MKQGDRWPFRKGVANLQVLEHPGSSPSSKLDEVTLLKSTEGVRADEKCSPDLTLCRRATALGDELTLSVVSHGHGAILQRLLRDLDSLEELRRVKVIVTLNLVDEDLDDELFPNLNIQVLRNHQPRGFAVNHNRAFQHCATPWFAVLNPDLRILENVFSALLSGAQGDERLALLTPQVRNSQGFVEDSVRANLTPWAILNRRVRGRAENSMLYHKFRWYAGMFLLLRSSAYLKVNGFDENFFLYCEDYDLCARLHLRSFKMRHIPEISVIHEAQRHSRTRIRYTWLHLGSIVRTWTLPHVWRIALQDALAGFVKTRDSEECQRRTSVTPF